MADANPIQLVLSTKVCRECGNEKPSSEFRQFPQNYDGLHAYCKKCDYKRNYEKRKANRLKVRVNLPTYTQKKCSRCKQVKPILAFSVSARDGHKSQCRDCRHERYAEAKARNPELYNEKKRRQYARFVAENPETAQERFRRYQRTHNLKRYCGFTLEDYEREFEKQGGVCAICKRTEDTKRGNGDDAIRPLHVDHCHLTNQFRGLLCSRCNTSLGLLREDIDVFTQAISYLKRHNGH